MFTAFREGKLSGRVDTYVNWDNSILVKRNGKKSGAGSVAVDSTGYLLAKIERKNAGRPKQKLNQSKNSTGQTTQIISKYF